MKSLPIAKIIVRGRHRKDMGDIAALAASIEELGLLHPIVVRPDNRLVAGERRLEAFRKLGRPEIPVTVIDIEAIARGEMAENTVRKDFLRSEQVAVSREVEAEERRLAKRRRGHGGPRSGKLPERSTGDRRDKIASRIGGVSGRTLEKARAIVDAAEKEPEKFGKLVADMDRSGRVDGPFKRLKVARQAAIIRSEPPPLPGAGSYRVIVADPPWPYELRKEDPSHRAAHPYPPMSIEQICAMPVASIAHKDCVLWLWATNHFMREAFTVLDASGFAHKTILTWVKDRMGTGDWLRGQTEHCLLAARGSPIVQLTNQTTVLHGPMRANSQKPEEFYAFVERLCPAPRYAELFSRCVREHWDGHGDEAKDAA